MSAIQQVMHTIGSHHISDQLLETNGDKLGGLLANGQYAWFASGANVILYSKQLESIVSSRSFSGNQKNTSLKITFITELCNGKETCNLLLVGCSLKSSGILFICQLPTLTTIRCIEIPYPVSYIATILKKPFAEDQLCDEFKIMSTILLVGMTTGAVFAIDLRQSHIETQLRQNEIVVNELKPNKLFIISKNEDCQEVKEMSDNGDCHLAMFLNENFHAYCKKQYSGKLKLSVSSLLYINETNTVAIGYSTGHFQLWDCKIMRTIYLLKEPKCIMPVTHIGFLEPSDDPNNLCYLWVIQSDNSKLPNASMIALTYEERIVMPNGCFSYRIYKGNGVKLEMSLRRETGIGRCISALSICNVNLFKNKTDMDEDCELRLFAMLMEVRKDEDADPESYIFLFDINQWYRSQMPSSISHLKVSNSYASFVKLPNNVSYLDFNISDKTLRPFSNNFRNNEEELYYPSSIYFECDCLMDKGIVKFKHAGVQQEILDQLLLKSWRLLINPSLVFNQCLHTNLQPFFWDKSDEYGNYSLSDQRSFVISILVENKMMSVLRSCAEEWKNGTYASSEATILHLVQCLWKHVMVVKQYADKLCVPLFDYSSTQLDKKNKRILNHCLSQMLCVKHFLENLHKAYSVHIINVDYSYRVYTLNLVTQYFKAVSCFLNYGLLPESKEDDPIHHIIRCDFDSLIQYAIKRRMEFGNSQLYLIDAIVNNEPKGYKLIEQWQHEDGETTKGLYPPSNVQCLLRIYLNAALSDQLKNYITIYFLIDICSSQNLDVTVANRMCNFAVEFDVDNKVLSTLCRASWLLDHDLFKEAMEILSSDKDWTKVDDKSWDWFHWTVLKLLVYKGEFFWAGFYLRLSNIVIVNINDHKFYINLQIMNNQCNDALKYIRSRPLEEKHILLEYFFYRCRETKKLKSLIEYSFEAEEDELFFVYLKKFNDTESLTLILLFLLQRGRYLEAVELNNLLKGQNKIKSNDSLAITSLLVDRFEKSIPKIMRESYSRPSFKNVYKNTEVKVKCLVDNKVFNIMDHCVLKEENIVKIRNPSIPNSSNSINLIMPAIKNTRKLSPSHDVVHHEKRRKIKDNDDDVLKPPKNEIEVTTTPIGKKVLEILNTPLIEKIVISPSISNCSSILKAGSAKKHQRSSIKSKDISLSKNVLRFCLPDNNETTIEQYDPAKSINVSKIDCLKNKTSYNNDSSETNNLANQTFIQSTTSSSSKDFLCNNPKMVSLDFDTVTSEMKNERMDISEKLSCTELSILKLNENADKKLHSEIDPNLLSDKNDIIFLSDEKENDEYEKMDISEETTYSNSSKLKIDEVLQKSNNSEVNLNFSNKNDIVLLSDDDEEKESSVVIPENTISIFEDKSSTKLLSFSYKETKIHHLKQQYTPVKTDEIIDEQKNNLEQGISINLDETVNRDSHPMVIDNFSLSPDPRVDVSTNEDFLSINQSTNIVNLTPNSDTCSIVSDQAEEPPSDDEDIIFINSEDENDIKIDNISSENSSSIQSLDVSCVSEESDLENTKYGRFKSQKRKNTEDTDEESQEFDTEKEDEEEDKEEKQQIDFKGVIYTEEDNLKLNDDESYEESDLEQTNIEEEVEENSSEHHYVDSNEENEENSSVHDEEFDEESEESKLEEYHNVDSCEENEEKNVDIYHVKVQKKDEENNFENDNKSRENNLIVEYDERKTNESEKKPKMDKSSNEDVTHNLETPVITLNDESEEKSTEVNETLEKTKREDTVEIIYSEGLKSNTPQNLPCTFDVYKENCYTNIGYEIEDELRENESNIIINDGKMIDSREHDGINETNKDNNPIHTSYDKNDAEKNEISNTHHETMSIYAQEYLSSNTNNYFEMSKKESSPIPEDGFDHLTMTEPESSQLESSKVESSNVNMTTPFLFGGSFFGPQEISDNKPMLLFGQVYSSEKQHLVVDSIENKPDDTQDLSTNNHKEITNNKESEEVELVDDIQDILELESLPESNPDENVDVQKHSKLQLEPQGTSSTHDNNQLSSPLNKSQLSSDISSETTKHISQTKLFETEKLLEDEKLTSIEICDPFKINDGNQIFQMQPAEQSVKADNTLQSNLDTQQKPISNVNETEIVELSSKIISDETSTSMLHLKTCSESQKSQKVTSNQNCQSQSIKEPVSTGSFVKEHDIYDDGTVLLNASNTNIPFDSLPEQKLVKASTTCLRSISTSNVNFLNNKDIKYIDPVVSKDITLEKDDTIILNCVNDEKSDKTKMHTSESINVIENVQENQTLEKVNAEFVKSVTCRSRSKSKESGMDKDLINKSYTDNTSDNILRFSSKSNIDLDNSSVSTNEIKLQQSISANLSNYTEENKPSTSKSYTNEQSEDIYNQGKKMDTSKQIILPDTEVIMTRSKTKSGANIKPEAKSPNLFRFSAMAEDNLRQVRIPLSKKRSKSQENISIIKRRSVRSRSVAAEEESTASRRFMLGLEQIPEEQTSNDDQMKLETKRALTTRKSKFRFFSNKSKPIENTSSSFNLQKNTKVKTPRRAKSVQLDPALTLSAVKTRQKRSSSVNFIISDDKSPTDKDDLKGFLQKALVLPKKKRKLSETESIKSEQIQKNMMNVDQDKNEPKSDNDSFQHMNDFIDYKDISPIPGDNSHHFLSSPIKKSLKKQKTVNFESEVSSSDESTNSKRIMTRSMNRNPSHVEIEFTEIGQKSEYQAVTENSVLNEKLKPKVNVSRRRITEAQNNEPVQDSKSSTIKQTNKQIKEITAEKPTKETIELSLTSGQRMTRSRKLILDKSVQSSSVLEKADTSKNLPLPKKETKRNLKHSKQKKNE